MLGCILEPDFCMYAPITVGFYTAVGVGIGAGVDAMITGDRTIYRQSVPRSSRRFNVAPVVGSEQKGVRVSFGF